MAADLSSFGIEAEIEDPKESRYLRGQITGKTETNLKCVDEIKYGYDAKKYQTLIEDLLSIIRGFRNGFIYGARIRFPHALVMTILFNRSSFKNMSKSIFKKTKEHSIHLGKYVALYKFFVVLIKRLFNLQNINYPFIHLLSGFIAGGIIWGQQSMMYIYPYIHGETCRTYIIYKNIYSKCESSN